MGQPVWPTSMPASFKPVESVCSWRRRLVGSEKLLRYGKPERVWVDIVPGGLWLASGGRLLDCFPGRRESAWLFLLPLLL